MASIASVGVTCVTKRADDTRGSRGLISIGRDGSPFVDDILSYAGLSSS